MDNDPIQEIIEKLNPEFLPKPGDRVRLKYSRNTPLEKNHKGTIVTLHMEKKDDEMWGISWDNFKDGHNLGGSPIKDNSGWYIRKENLEIIERIVDGKRRKMQGVRKRSAR